jgi:hypothetical protein
MAAPAGGAGGGGEGGGGAFTLTANFGERFTKHRELRREAFGRVYECAPTPAGLAAHANRPLPALAVLVVHITNAPQLEALERECNVWSRLAHGGVVRLVEAFLEFDDVAGTAHAHLVMEKPPMLRPSPAGSVPALGEWSAGWFVRIVAL